MQSNLLKIRQKFLKFLKNKKSFQIFKKYFGSTHSFNEYLGAAQRRRDEIHRSRVRGDLSSPASRPLRPLRRCRWGARPASPALLWLLGLLQASASTRFSGLSCSILTPTILYTSRELLLCPALCLPQLLPLHTAQHNAPLTLKLKSTQTSSAGSRISQADQPQSLPLLSTADRSPPPRPPATSTPKLRIHPRRAGGGSPQGETSVQAFLKSSGSKYGTSAPDVPGTRFLVCGSNDPKQWCPLCAPPHLVLGSCLSPPHSYVLSTAA